MKNNRNLQRKTTYIKYDKYASSFWTDADFDTSFNIGSKKDFTKLAAMQRAIANFVNIVTGKQIPVSFQRADSSFTDGNRVVIGTKLEGKNFDPAVGLALHEGSHIAYTDFSLLKGNKLTLTPMADIVRLHGVDPDLTMAEADFEIIKNLLNWVEDRRIDYKIYTIAPGYRMYYEAMYDKYFNDKVIDKALISKEKNQETWDDYLFHIINFTNPNRQLDTLKALKEIWNVVDLKNINRLKNTNDALLVAISIYKIIKDAVAETKGMQEVKSIFENFDTPDVDASGSTISINPSANDSHDAESNDDVAAMAASDLTDDDDATDSPKSQLSDNELKKLQSVIQSQREFINGNAQKTGRLSKKESALVNALRESGTESRTVYTGHEGGTYGALDTVVIKKLTPSVICTLSSLFNAYSDDVLNNKKSILDTNGHPNHGVRDIYNTDNAVTAGIILGKRLGNKLQLRNNDRTLKTTRLQSGKIDRRLINQLGYENINVFFRTITDKYKNYFIHISIDASGSMNGIKLRNAITSAVAIAQAASMTTGIRVQISFRGTDTLSSGTERCVTLYAYDSAHDNMSKIRSLFKFIGVFGCTPEGVAFKSIEKDIIADAKGDELIFINYSDGCPSTVQGSVPGFDGVNYTQKVVNGLRSLGINVISYFIHQNDYYRSEQDNFRKMYGPDSKFIDPVSVLQVANTINAKFTELAK